MMQGLQMGLAIEEIRPGDHIFESVRVDSVNCGEAPQSTSCDEGRWLNGKGAGRRTGEPSQLLRSYADACNSQPKTSTALALPFKDCAPKGTNVPSSET